MVSDGCLTRTRRASLPQGKQIRGEVLHDLNLLCKHTPASLSLSLSLSRTHTRTHTHTHTHTEALAPPLEEVIRAIFSPVISCSQSRSPAVQSCVCVCVL